MPEFTGGLPTALGDPLISEEHIACFGWASQEEMHDIADMAIRVNDFMCGLFAGIGIRLIDFKLEFGRLWDGDFARLILADEPTGNLDSQSANDIFELLQSVNQTQKSACLIVTHDPALAKRCGRQIQIVDGQLLRG